MSIVYYRNLKVGSILKTDVYRGDVLLVRKGAVVTAAMLRTFENMHVTLTDGVADENPAPQRIEDLTYTAYMSLVNMDIDDVVKYATALVDNITNGEFDGMLHLVFDYDECTYTHSKNVTLLALLAAIGMQYSVRELQIIAVGALLHDIGKLQIPTRILDKPARLTPEEFDVIKKHPSIGYAMVKDNPSVSMAVKQIILQHHENYDGTGYPRAIEHENGYKLARLVHICDVYEAMCARRPYKPPIPREQCRDFLFTNSGRMFEPVMVKKFLEIIPAYIVGEELDVDGKMCIVVQSHKGDDPVVQYGDDTLPLSELKRKSAIAS